MVKILSAAGLLFLVSVVGCSTPSTQTSAPPAPTAPTPEPAPNRSPSISSLAVSPDGVALVAATRVAFTADSSDPDGDAVTHEWNFGDGATASNASGTVEHAYASPGSFTVTVTAVDNRGGSSSTVTATVTAVTMTGKYRYCGSGLNDPEIEVTQTGATYSGFCRDRLSQGAVSGSLAHPRQVRIESSGFTNWCPVYTLNLDNSGKSLIGPYGPVWCKP